MLELPPVDGCVLVSVRVFALAVVPGCVVSAPAEPGVLIKPASAAAFVAIKPLATDPLIKARRDSG